MYEVNLLCLCDFGVNVIGLLLYIVCMLMDLFFMCYVLKINEFFVGGYVVSVDLSVSSVEKSVMIVEL